MAENNEFFNENFDEIFGEENKNNDLNDENLKEESENSKETIQDEVDENAVDIDDLDFDEDLDEKPEEKKERKKFDFKKKISGFKYELSKYRDIKNLTERRFYNITKIILVVFLLLIMGVTTLQRTTLKNRVEKDIIMIKQSEFVSNLPSYIYIKKVIDLDGEAITLEKMLIDSDTTIFYFDPGYSEIAMDEYVIYVVDENNKYYGAKNAEVEFFEGEYIIPIKQLEEGIEQFSLHIVSSRSEEDKTLSFKLEDGLKIPPAKYANGDISINYSEGVSLNLINAHFSPAYSSLDFLLETDDASSFRYVVGHGGTEEKVILYENGIRLRSIKSTEKIYNVEDEDANIISIDFNPVKNLNSVIEIVISEVYKKYEVNKIFDTRELLLREIQDYHTIKLGEHDINFEGMRRFDDRVVLVAHAVDTKYYDKIYEQPEIVQSKNIYDPIIEPMEPPQIDKSDPYADRVTIFVDATLTVQLEGEETFQIEGEIRTSKNGTDIVFADDRLKNTTSKNYELKINNILFREDDFQLRLNLDELSYELDEETKQNLDFITNSLKSRLKYKSKEKILSRVSGFSDEILDNWNVMKYYSPVDVVSPARYDVAIDSYVYRDGMFIAIVAEQWNAVTEEGFQYYNAIHEIHVKEVDGKLQIIKDNIIEKR